MSVEQAWARATAAGQPVGGAYLELRNEGAVADRLLGASSAAADSVELHSMSMDGEVMRMRQVESIELPAGATVRLAPGGYHLMLMGLRQPLLEGTRLPLTLRLAKAGELKVEAEVRKTAPEHDHGEHKH